MGGPSGNRGMLRKRYPHAFNEMARDTERKRTYPNHHLPIDMLVALRSIGYSYDSEKDNTATGFEWAMRVLKRVFYAFNQQFVLVELCMDNGALVPPRKAPEEAERGKQKRNAQASAERKAAAAGQEAPPPPQQPLPKGSQLCEAGIWIPAAADGSTNERIEKVSMDRLLATRWLRSQLLELVVHCIKQFGLERMGLTNAAGRFLIVDYGVKQRDKGGTKYNRSDDWREFVRPPVLCCGSGGGITDLPIKGYRHPFGEADLGMLWWAHVFRDTDCVLDSNDTDQYPVCLSYLAHHPRPSARKGRLRVRYLDSSSGKVWIDDMDELAACLKDDKTSASCVVLFHALGGNDFCPKKAISDGVGVAPLFDATFENKYLVRASKLLKKEFVLDDRHDEQCVWSRVRFPEQKSHTAERRNRNDVIALLEKYLDSTNSPRHVNRSMSTRGDAFRAVLWSWQYYYEPFLWLADLTACHRNVKELLVFFSDACPIQRPITTIRSSMIAFDDNDDSVDSGVVIVPASWHSPAATAAASRVSAEDMEALRLLVEE